MPGGSSVGFGETQNLGRNHFEDEGGTIAAFVMENAVSGLELPLSIPFCFPCFRQLPQPIVVNDPNSLTLNDHVNTFLPAVAPGGDNHLRICT